MKLFAEVNDSKDVLHNLLFALGVVCAVVSLLALCALPLVAVAKFVLGAKIDGWVLFWVSIVVPVAALTGLGFMVWSDKFCKVKAFDPDSLPRNVVPGVFERDK